MGSDLAGRLSSHAIADQKQKAAVGQGQLDLGAWAGDFARMEVGNDEGVLVLLPLQADVRRTADTPLRLRLGPSLRFTPEIAHRPHLHFTLSHRGRILQTKAGNWAVRPSLTWDPHHPGGSRLIDEMASRSVAAGEERGSPRRRR